MSLAQRATVERIEASLGSPPRTIMLEGWHFSLEDALEGSQTQGETGYPVEQTEDAQ